MRVFAISDLHLSLSDGRLTKPMDRFGENWRDHHEQIAGNWRDSVADEDLVLLAGDLSWALKPEQAGEDLAWLEALPGRKIIIKGNHDFWMPSRRKLRALLPTTVEVIQNDCRLVGGVLVFGSRLWTVPGLSFPISWEDEPGGESGLPGGQTAQDARLLRREIKRLELSIAEAAEMAAGNPVRTRICMTHFPPTDALGKRTAITDMLAAAGTDICIYGHIHGLAPGGDGDAIVDGVRYCLTSCDSLDFRVLELAI